MLWKSNFQNLELDMESLSNDKEHYAVRNIYCESLWTPHSWAALIMVNRAWSHIHELPSLPTSGAPSSSSQHPIKAAQVAGQPQVHIHPQASYKSPWLQLTITPPDPVRAHSRRSIDPTQPSQESCALSPAEPQKKKTPWKSPEPCGARQPLVWLATTQKQSVREY